MSRHRTFLRLQAIDTYHIHFVVPGWDPIMPIGIAINTIPDHVVKACYNGQDYFYAVVDLSADTQDDLAPSDWEIG